MGPGPSMQGSFRTCCHFRAATGRASGQFQLAPACATRTPRRLLPAIRIREGLAGCACPAPRSHGISPARTPRVSRVWSHRDIRHGGARSSRGRSTRLQIEETRDREYREVSGRAGGTSGRERGESVGGPLLVQCPGFRLRPSCASGSLYSQCPASPCSSFASQVHRRRRTSPEVMDMIKRDRSSAEEPIDYRRDVRSPASTPDHRVSGRTLVRMIYPVPCCRAVSTRPVSVHARVAFREENHPHRRSVLGSGRARGGICSVSQSKVPTPVQRRPVCREGSRRTSHIAASGVSAQVRKTLPLRVLRLPERFGHRGARLGNSLSKAVGRRMSRDQMHGVGCIQRERVSPSTDQGFAARSR